MKPRVLFVGRTRYTLPLSRPLAAKWDALAEQFELRVLARGGTGDATFHLDLPENGAAFHATLPRAIRREARDFEPQVIVCQSPYEAAAALLVKGDAKVLLELHGDWRSATRLYGSRGRRGVAWIADRVAANAVRRADGLRTISEYTTRLVRAEGREPDAVFPAAMDLAPFLGPPVPLPVRPRALFVGVLEAYKAIDVLADAWTRVAGRLPEAELHIVGKGSRTAVVERLVGKHPQRVRWTPELDADGVAAALDAASFLVLPSRSEGMGRVVVEALCRTRPVLGSRVGGIPDLVRDGENGVLVPPGDVEALAAALEALLGDREVLETLAKGAWASAQPWLATPADYARRMRELVDSLL
ncbi:MAG: glycogen synthase [Gaiellaceae bacterium]|nr:glycogen synthase [Gaiellaceae bacterium]